MVWSIALSILVHLVVLLLSPLFIQTIFPPGGNVSIAPRQVTDFGMQAIIAIPSENAPDTPDTPARELAEVTPSTPTATTPAPDASDAPLQPGAGDPSPAAPAQPVDAAPGDGGNDALRPGYSDPRMYVTPSPYIFDRRTDHERYMEGFRARIDAVNDSMGLAAARQRDATDWTTTDANGNRWGLSPEGLHLGGITIPRVLLPLPGATGDNASREAAAERQRQREEIQRQEAERERRDTQNERIEATREDRDRARDSGGGG